MAGSEARIGIRSDSKQAEQSVKSVQGLFAGLAQDAKKSILTGVGLGAGVTAFSALKSAIGGATDFMGDAVHAAIEDEASVSRLTASLKANVPGWDGSTAAIERRIEAGQRLGFTDDDLRASLTTLVGATHDVGKAQELQAAAMDLARFKGIDLASASDALIKVEGGRYKILASLGIQLGKNATQTEVLAAIQKVASGQAEAFGNTTAGAAQEAGIAFDELKEEIGRQLMPVVKDLAKFARDSLIPAIRDSLPVFKSVAGVIGELAKIGVPLLVVALGSKLVGALKSVGSAAGGTLGPLGAMIGLGLALGDAGKKGAAGAAAATIEMKYGAAAAKVFGDALEKTGGDGQKSMDALNEYLRTGFVPSFLASTTASFGAMPPIVERGVEDSRRALAAGGTKIVDESMKIGESIPRATADGMLKAQQELADPIQQLLDFIKAALSPAQVIARDMGFLSSKEYAAGLASSNPLVVLRAQELGAAARAELGNTAGFSLSGFNIGDAWAKGLISGLEYQLINLIREMGKYKANLMGFSPPKEGPLKDIDKGGFNIGKAWAQGVVKGIGPLNLPTLPGFVSGSGAGRSGSGFVGAVGGGGPVVIQLQVDGRTLAEIVDRNLRYMRPGGPAALPR